MNEAIKRRFDCSFTDKDGRLDVNVQFAIRFCEEILAPMPINNDLTVLNAVEIPRTKQIPSISAAPGYRKLARYDNSESNSEFYMIRKRPAPLGSCPIYAGAEAEEFRNICSSIVDLDTKDLQRHTPQMLREKGLIYRIVWKTRSKK